MSATVGNVHKFSSFHGQLPNININSIILIWKYLVLKVLLSTLLYFWVNCHFLDWLPWK